MKILMVCQGNICRSPAAEYLLRKMLGEKQLDTITIESAGLLKQTEGRVIHPKIAKWLKWYGCDAHRHHATYITHKNLSEYSYIMAMDRSIEQQLRTKYAKDFQDNIYLFGEIAGSPKQLDIADPMKTKHFWATTRKINQLCRLWTSYFIEEPE